MRMEAGIRETLPFIFPKESAVTQDDVVDLITGTSAVQPVPFLLGLLSFSLKQTICIRRFDRNLFSRVIYFQWTLTALWKCARVALLTWMLLDRCNCWLREHI